MIPRADRCGNRNTVAFSGRKNAGALTTCQGCAGDSSRRGSSGGRCAGGSDGGESPGARAGRAATAGPVCRRQRWRRVAWSAGGAGAHWRVSRRAGGAGPRQRGPWSPQGPSAAVAWARGKRRARRAGEPRRALPGRAGASRRAGRDDRGAGARRSGPGSPVLDGSSCLRLRWSREDLRCGEGVRAHRAPEVFTPSRALRPVGRVDSAAGRRSEELQAGVGPDGDVRPTRSRGGVRSCGRPRSGARRRPHGVPAVRPGRAPWSP